MLKKLRRQKFRLGRLHGKPQAKKTHSEAHIQRTVFLNQKLKLWLKRDKAVEIRIFAYEVPLEERTSRGECVDLMGYDKSRNLYLFELKKKKSSEKIKDIVEQINGYEEAVSRLLPDLEREFEEEFFFPIKFCGIKKFILAPREFFETRKDGLEDHSVYYSYFRDKDINKRKPGQVINIHMVKK